MKTKAYIRDGHILECPYCGAPEPVEIQARELTSVDPKGEEKITKYIDKWCRICETKITEVHH